MTSTAALTITEDAPGRYRLAGSINEHAVFDAVRNTTATQIEVHLAGVRHINSYGVREWVELLGALRSRDVRVILTAVSPALARQMNMISSTCEVARIDSVVAPYVCPTCGDEAEQVVDSAAARSFDGSEGRPCRQCGATLELDDVPGVYFGFLRRGRP